MKTKRKLILFIVLAFIIIFAYLIKKQTGTLFNEDNVKGNLAGNLMNNGLFCEIDNKIYFSNLNDDGSLYSMNLEATEFKKIYNDRVRYINAAGKYIYYSRHNNEKVHTSSNLLGFNTTGIYRINKDGSNIKSLYKKPSGLVNLNGNYLYYQHYDTKEGLKLYKVKIDGSDETKLSNDAISPSSILNGILYYVGTRANHSIHAMNLSTGVTSLLYEGNTYNAMTHHNYIYYISQSDNYSIQRINIDGTNPITIVPDRCSTYNLSISGKYLYYQMDGGETNGIYRMNLETKVTTNIILGNYNNINITSEYVFFQEFESNQIFMLPVGEQATLTKFNPPILK